MRGARTYDGRAVHLLAAFDTATGTVLAQTCVDGKTNEITAFAPLLDRLDVTDALVTADALHTQRGHATYLTGRGAHYLLTVKANQPGLLAELAALPWTQVPVADRTTNTSHGRVEQRTVQLATVTTGIGFPHAVTALRIARRSRRRTNARWHTETVTRSPTSPPPKPTQPSSPTPSEPTGASKTACTGSATSPSAKTPPRSARTTGPPSWRLCATSPSACTNRPKPPTSPPPADT